MTSRCIAASTSAHVAAPAGLFANKSLRSVGHCAGGGVAAAQSTSVGFWSSTTGGDGKDATRTTSSHSARVFEDEKVGVDSSLQASSPSAMSSSDASSSSVSVSYPASDSSLSYSEFGGWAVR